MGKKREECDVSQYFKTADKVKCNERIPLKNLWKTMIIMKIAKEDEQITWERQSN